MFLSTSRKCNLESEGCERDQVGNSRRREMGPGGCERNWFLVKGIFLPIVPCLSILVNPHPPTFPRKEQLPPEAASISPDPSPAHAPAEASLSFCESPAVGIFRSFQTPNHVLLVNKAHICWICFCNKISVIVPSQKEKLLVPGFLREASFWVPWNP